MVALLTFLPTLIASAVLGVSLAFDRPVSLDRVWWLITYVQIFFLVLGTLIIMLGRPSTRPLPYWRLVANRWVGRIMAVFGLFYLVAFIIVAH